MVDEKGLGEDVYYLPHHGVYKNTTGPKKLRIVFDSAAIYRGSSLNDALFCGPSLLNQLPCVLMGFREQEVAFTADIEAMFSRIRLRPEDARRHLLLWHDESGSEVIYKMDRLTFGDTCSPYVAIETVRRVATDHGQGEPEAVDAILKKLYMDDYLDSTPTVEEAITRAKTVQRILAEGDFHLRKWLSNSQQFIEAVDPGSSMNVSYSLMSDNET